VQASALFCSSTSIDFFELPGACVGTLLAAQCIA
jgi:hypothetical protein